MIEPLRLSFEVACTPEHAFDTWTTRFDLWWPPGHTVSGDPGATVVLEAALGGRIFERTTDGFEIEWGEITQWEAPRRLSYLWHIRRDRADATDVEVTFVALDDGTTRVDIVHRGWDRLGAGGPAWRDANAGGWNGLMPHFVAACQGEPHQPPTSRQGVTP
ncbi:MAG: SRPBCC family protein [Actinomycetota bacterium]|nr:SRPBCC family protein [Actinomycetota bacterium]